MNKIKLTFDNGTVIVVDDVDNKVADALVAMAMYCSAALIKSEAV
jgi:hypothetical protein